jgi:deoxyribose-phosphate aldolase
MVQKCITDLKGSDVKVACVIGFHEGTYDLLYKLQ